MFNVINILLIGFLSDLMITFSLKRLFLLKVNKWELLFLQIIFIAPMVVFVLCQTSVLIMFGLKMVAGGLLCVLITDSFKAGVVSKIYFTYVALMFSVYGFLEFIILLASAISVELLGEELQSLFYGICVLGVWAYVVMIYLLVNKLTKFNKLKQHLASVTFSIYGKHIEVVGLIDSGNSLVDKVTNKPVIVMSVSALKKYFKECAIYDLKDSGLCERFVDCVLAGGAKLKIPIYDIGSVCIKRDGEVKNFDCVLGFVNQKFYDEKDYQCLIHRNCF